MSKVIPLQPYLPNAFIAEKDISIQGLCSTLDGAVMEHEVYSRNGEDIIYVRRGVDFPLWIQIEDLRRLIRLQTFAEPDERITGKFEDLNELNKSTALVQFHLDGNRIYGDYWMTFSGGLSPMQFVVMLNDFSAAFAVGMKDFILKARNTEEGK